MAALGAAVLGKCVACWPAGRPTGICNHEALDVGMLMDACGLVELVIIINNIAFSGAYRFVHGADRTARARPGDGLTSPRPNHK
jgi:Kef-type K+ transport system membrane component KefB